MKKLLIGSAALFASVAGIAQVANSPAAAKILSGVNISTPVNVGRLATSGAVSQTAIPGHSVSAHPPAALTTHIMRSSAERKMTRP